MPHPASSLFVRDAQDYYARAAQVRRLAIGLSQPHRIALLRYAEALEHIAEDLGRRAARCFMGSRGGIAAQNPNRSDDGEARGEARILVVEDHADFGRVMCRVLAERGYATTHAATLAGAKRLIAEQPFELVIANGLVPGGAGAELAQLAAQRGIKHLLVSGQPESIRLHERSGALVLRKPFSDSELLELVRDLLAMKR
jgi:CheY-like chemotaxis protein